MTASWRRVLALFRFHAAGGARVAARNAIVIIGAIVAVLGMSPAPVPVLLRVFALGLGSTRGGNSGLVALALLAHLLARDAVPRLTLSLGGWARSLPVDGVAHRRGVVAGLAIVQMPLAAAVAIATLLTAVLYHAPVSFAKLLGTPVALVAAGAAAVPARRGVVAAPLAAAAALLGAMGQWPALAAAVVAFALSDALAGSLRFASPRATISASASPATPRTFRFTWRAVSWRLLAPVPLTLLALAAAWFYTRNNELVGAELGFVARLWSVIAVALYVGALGDSVAARRPVWPWARSLPWSSRARAIDDALALGLPALGVVAGAFVVQRAAAVVALLALPPLAALGAALLPGARGHLTRVSGRLVAVGTALGVGCAYEPWLAVAALLATPFLIRLAAQRARREVVTGWKELHHDAAGDSLAWSAR